MELMINYVGLLSNKGIPPYGRHIQGRSQPRSAAQHGRSVDRGVPSRETKTLYSSRNLPDDAALEFVDDRVGHVAFLPTTSAASAS